MSGRAVVAAAGRISRCRVALVGDGLDILWRAPSAATDLAGLRKNIDVVAAEASRRGLALTGLSLAVSDLTGARDVAAEQGHRLGLLWSVNRMADSLLAGERMLGTVQDAVGIVVLDGDEPAVGLQIGDRAYRGAHGRAGDITHLGLDRAGPIRCRCGLNGCLGALLEAGVTAPEPPRPASCEAAPLRALGWLAVAAITLVNIINPELLVVSGAAVEDPADLAWFTDTVRAGCLSPTRAGLRRVTGAHPDSAMLGAATCLLDRSPPGNAR